MRSKTPPRHHEADAGHVEALLDDALRMTFPASDPIAPAVDTEAADQKREPGVTSCTHRDQIRNVQPNTRGCEECLKAGDPWRHLRMCLACGHVGCCDSSLNKHATKHFHATRHPIMRSIEPGESWMWCYIDEVMLN